MRRGEPVCVVETTKASVEIEAPGAGTLVRLCRAGEEVELGRRIAYVAESAEELAALLESRRAEQRAEPAPPAERRATRKAIDLAERHGVDLGSIDKEGFITEQDVAAVVAQATRRPADERKLLAGASTEGVTLPASFAAGGTAGALDPAFLESLRADPEAFRALSSADKCAAYREHGAAIGASVTLEEGTLIVSPRIVIEDDVRIGRGATIRCEEVVAIGALTHFGPSLELTCRRAYVGTNVHAGRAIRIGGGGHRDPWATVAIGDLTFVGDEVFINPCRPVLIGREVFVTQRSMIVTHNIGHSVLEGFENRFAPVVLEDRSQLGLGSIVYAGCRIGREAIVGSGSYVVSDIPPGKFAIGVPARVAGPARRTLSRPRQVELVRRMLDDLHELLELNGHAVSALPEGGIELQAEHGRAVVTFVERLDGSYRPPADAAVTVVLTLDFRCAEPPGGCAVLDLVGRQVYGEGGLVLDSVREFCRKRGIHFEPGPWRYRGGLV